MIASLLDFVQQREPGRAAVRVVSSDAGGRQLLQVVTDDMPFLVDTVSMVVSASTPIHVVIHPVLKVVRDASGRLQRFDDAAGHAESVMYFEIDPLADEAAQEQLRAGVDAAPWARSFSHGWFGSLPVGPCR